MRKRPLLLGVLLSTLATQALAQVQTGASVSTQQSPGGFYDMGDYAYFTEDQAKPAPPPAHASAQTGTTGISGQRREAMTQTLQADEPSNTASATPHVYPKGDLAKARADAKALGTTARRSSATIPTSTDLAATIPGYTAAKQPGEGYADDPDGLAAAGGSAAASSEAWTLVTDPGRRVATVPPGDLARARDVEKSPDSYLAGQSLGGADASCKPLHPPGTTDYYEATCNKGARVSDAPATCTGRMDPVVTDTLRYFYYGVRDQNEGNGFARNSVMARKIGAGICRAEPAAPHICDAQVELGAGGTNPASYLRWCKGLSSMRTTAQLYSCSAEIPPAEIPSHRNHRTGTVWLRTEGERSVAMVRNEGSCAAMEADTTCTATGPEVCTEGPATRIVSGVAVTQSCWAWSRPFTCQRITDASDCDVLDADTRCTYLRDECLDDPQVGPCKVSTKVYRCPVPVAPGNDAKQYICGDDVYCINGDCEPVEREASTEFKDAAVGLHALGQADAEFDSGTMALFSGSRETCNKKIFGASNCCSGKGVPLLTPWLCSAAEKQLDVKDDKGLCHKLGSYCSDKVLGICVTSKDAYCCFASKLTRILQEQGRPQIGKAWGSAKSGTCEGFTLDEFSRLDLSVMNFSEVVAEFTDAAKLPDEIETSRMIQERIRDYYDSRKGR